jgi:predicted O-methyltransferase YrrM
VKKFLLKILQSIFCGLIHKYPQLLKLNDPPGHYYSPIPCLNDIQKREHVLWPDHLSYDLPALDLNIEEQIKVLIEFEDCYRQAPFSNSKQVNYRYYYDNPMFLYSDAIFLYCMLKKRTPKKIIEIGSGFSSCVMMDVNEYCCDNRLEITFIDPFPERLRSLMMPRDVCRYPIIEREVQECDASLFASLQSGDYLFIDSSHVSKTASDVNFILFEILPALRPGVFIHFHDIFYPFEYPKEWIFAGRAWNESYVVRAFLQYNEIFKIYFFASFLNFYCEERIRKNMPLCLKNTGASLWLKKC